MNNMYKDEGHQSYRQILKGTENSNFLNSLHDHQAAVSEFKHNKILTLAICLKTMTKFW